MTLIGMSDQGEEAQVPSLGIYADYYLKSHGYCKTAIEEIEWAWDTSSNKEGFCETLMKKGMLLCEASYLTTMISGHLSST